MANQQRLLQLKGRGRETHVYEAIDVSPLQLQECSGGVSSSLTIF